MKKQIIVAAVVVSAIASLLVSQQATAQARQAHTAWEYGELVIQGETAFFATEDELHELHPPKNRESGNTSTSSNWGRVYYKTSVKLFHLNRLGQEGWEIISTSAIEDGFAYTTRRAFR